MFLGMCLPVADLPPLRLPRDIHFLGGHFHRVFLPPENLPYITYILYMSFKPPYTHNRAFKGSNDMMAHESRLICITGLIGAFSKVFFFGRFDGLEGLNDGRVFWGSLAVGVCLVGSWGFSRGKRENESHNTYIYNYLYMIWYSYKLYRYILCVFLALYFTK